jgi:hypothetical protein
MSHVAMKSFRLVRPCCPHCGSNWTRIDWLAVGNLLRLPVAIISVATFLYPAIGIRMRCRECGGGFLASSDGTEASKG